MNSAAVVFKQPQQVHLQTLSLPPCGANEVEVAVAYSGIASKTEQQLWQGLSPTVLRSGRPVVPGNASIGHITQAPAHSTWRVGQAVWVSGAQCFEGVTPLYGASASRLVVPADQVWDLGHEARAEDVLLGLAATAYHAVAGTGRGGPFAAPELIIGHNTLGRLLARLVVAAGLPPPKVWETQAQRLHGAQGYIVTHPDDDEQSDYATIYDVRGEASDLDPWLCRLRPGGELVLASDYPQGLRFAHPLTWVQETRIRMSSGWTPADLRAIQQLIGDGRLSLEGLLTHLSDAQHTQEAYATACDDSECLAMALNWKDFA